MLFNSYFFIFAFLPATLLVYFALGRLSRNSALRWIILASLVFYAWWRPANVLIILPAMLVNFGVAKAILHAGETEKTLTARIWLILGVSFNIAVLGYFKYTNFALSVSNDILGTAFSMEEIVLPLGISFITFQKIAFLIDVHGKRVTSFRFQDFFSFILFFPQLIAGPIVHYREMMPQFHAAKAGWNREDVSIGLTLFFFGLFKKVVLADGIAPLVSTIFADAQAGEAITLVPAWLAAVGFTLQIYFDFSGYSDMALGAARLFGIRLPVNFRSPLQATNIIDFWLRWHVSLTRFLTAYLYNPISLTLTRRRLAAGKPGFGGARTSLGAFLQLLAIPTIFTMFISGIWHGAGYLFMLWGLLHGMYLTVNHGWRLVAQKRNWVKSPAYERWMGPVGFVITFIAVVISMVVFRAPDLGAATSILAGLTGSNGIELPAALVQKLAPIAPILDALSVEAGQGDLRKLIQLVLWVVGLGSIALLLPNSLEVLDRHEPAIGVMPAEPGRGLHRVRWTASLPWAIAISAISFLAVSRIGGYTEFLYWQF